MDARDALAKERGRGQAGRRHLRPAPSIGAELHGVLERARFHLVGVAVRGDVGPSGNDVDGLASARIDIRERFPGDESATASIAVTRRMRGRLRRGCRGV
jgi:hypothetical protein